LPNYVTHRCTVHGSAEDIAAFQKLMIREAEDKTFEDEIFDFARLIPMPPILSKVDKNTISENLYHILYRTKKMPESWASMNKYCSYRLGPMHESVGKSDEEIRALLVSIAPENLQKAELMKEAVDTTGFTSWYDWSIRNWGTKWNSMHFKRISDDPFVFVFDTAWSAPVPVFEALAERFPNLQIHCATFDEGWGFAAEGWFNPPDGETDYVETEPNDAMYEKVYGATIERDEDEDEDEAIDEGQILGDGSEEEAERDKPIWSA
jgi:hypothetical protein